MRSVVSLLLASCSSCAVGEGDPWGVLRPSLSASIDWDGSRQTDQERWLTNLSYSIEVTSLVLDIETMGVRLRPRGVGATNFDPASPPAGYSLCHNGHCHSDDGRLVDYEVIAADLAGGDSGSSTGLPAGSAALAPGAQPIAVALNTNACPNQCWLQRGEMALAEVVVAQVSLVGTVFDEQAGSPRIDAQGEGIALTIPLEATVTAPLEGAIDHGHPVGYALQLLLVVTPRLFDNLEWETLVSDLAVGGVTAELAAQQAGQIIGEQFTESTLLANSARFDP